jgi:CrcB protein
MPRTGRAVPDPDSRPAHARPLLWLAVVAGALPGTLARYYLARAITPAPRTFPTATLVTNLAGAFALGVLLEALVRRGDDTGGRRIARLLLGTGFLGAFTTYSTFAVDTDLLIADHCPGIAVGYLLATVVGGTLLAFAGVLAASNGRRR